MYLQSFLLFRESSGFWLLCKDGAMCLLPSCHLGLFPSVSRLPSTLASVRRNAIITSVL